MRRVTSRVCDTSKGLVKGFCSRGHAPIRCGSVSPLLIGALIYARSRHFCGRFNVSFRKMFTTTGSCITRKATHKTDAVARRLIGGLFGMHSRCSAKLLKRVPKMGLLVVGTGR